MTIFSRDGQSQAGAGFANRCGVIGPGERFEYDFHLLSSHADSRIAHLEDDHRVSTSRIPSHVDLNLSIVGELGRLLFNTRGCVGCHSLGTISNSTIGPDLNNIAVTASASEIRASIVDPDVEISENCLSQWCPAGLMPDFGEILDERDIDAFVEFLLEYGGGESEVGEQQPSR